MEQKDTWRTISIREKLQLINGTVLIFAAIVLYFVAFILTMTIGMEIVSAGATLLATGLAFFGITSYIKNQMVNFEANLTKRINEIEERERNKGYDTEREERQDNED